MQLLAEVYTILKTMGNNPNEIADILESWKPIADSYLLGITVKILRIRDREELINKIVGRVGNKGSGHWTTIASAQLGVPSTLIASALFTRYNSFYREERVLASKNFNIIPSHLNLDIQDVLKGYQFARIINHFQGVKLISEASKTYNWKLNLSEIARIWTNGCFIKSDFMIKLISILKEDDNMLTHPAIINKVKALKPFINKVVSECILNELTIFSLSESVSFLNSYTKSNSSANIIQAQRNYSGAHAYQRIDDDSDKFYYTIWN